MDLLWTIVVSVATSSAVTGVLVVSQSSISAVNAILMAAQKLPTPEMTNVRT